MPTTTLMGFIFAELNIRGINFREFLGSNLRKLIPRNSLKMTNSRKLIPRKINSIIYFPKILQNWKKRANKSQKWLCWFSKFWNSRKLIPQIFRKWKIRENWFREKVIPRKLIPRILIPRILIPRKLIPLRYFLLTPICYAICFKKLVNSEQWANLGYSYQEATIWTISIIFRLLHVMYIISKGMCYLVWIL